MEFTTQNDCASAMFAPEIEVAMVSLCWHEPDRLATLYRELDPAACILQLHLRYILEAVDASWREVGAVDFATIAEALRVSRRFEECGGLEGLNSVYDTSAYGREDPERTERIFRHHIELLKRYSAVRKADPAQAHDLLPAWPFPVEYLDFEVQPVEKPRPIIDGLLDGASRLIFGGGSKTYKTWAMSDQALSIAAGAPWLGFDTYQARVAYVNFELKEYYMQKRLRAIREAKKLNIARDALLVWNLRGYCVSLALFKTRLITLIRRYGILVVFIDPFYQLLGDKDERVSAELWPILAAFDEINRLTGATIICAAHFSKGNQAAKDCLDRISGGASLGRHPDNLITLTKHEQDQAFSVELTVRDFAPIESFVVKWEHPLLVRTDLDPAKLKRPANRPTSCDAQRVFELIAQHDDELTTGELVSKAVTELGWSRRTIITKLNFLRDQKRIFISKVTQRWNINSKG